MHYLTSQCRESFVSVAQCCAALAGWMKMVGIVAALTPFSSRKAWKSCNSSERVIVRVGAGKESWGTGEFIFPLEERLTE